MKPIKTLIFIFSIMLLLGVAWYFFPAEGIKVGPFQLRFASLAEKQAGGNKEVDVDQVREMV